MTALSPQYFKGSEIVRYAKQDEVYLDLAAGRIDAMLCDSVAIDGGFLKKPQGKGFRLHRPAYDDPKILRHRLGHRRAQGRHRAAAEASTPPSPAIRANGTYKKIQDKYFDFDVYGEVGRPPHAARLRPQPAGGRALTLSVAALSLAIALALGWPARWPSCRARAWPAAGARPTPR
jgi:hypothetical protein